MMNTSIELKQITAALVAFHKEVGKIAKDARNPFFKSSYASLSGILDSINEPLTNNGLSIVQFPDGENGLTTRLCHISGEWMEATYSMRPVKDDPQGRGSAITYQRRYAIGAVLSLNIDEDDDGNSSSGTNDKQASNGQQNGSNNTPPPTPKDDKPWLNENTDAFTKALLSVGDGSVTIAQIEKKYKLSKTVKAVLQAAQK
jgi:hypothetical protein